MPDKNQTSNTTANPPSNADDVIVSPDAPAPVQNGTEAKATETNPTVKTVAGYIQDVHNILITLSSDPSVDEMAAAIGLSLYLDRTGKRATSIYSGKTPNILEFLQPEKTFETSSDVLRDFVIALDKNKADHLRYKLDGDYVKIFITPYKTRIDKDDFEFSLGDFNIELVLALNVPSGIDLDDALREHGRVMHDATIINITNGNPGKFGDIEWNDKSKSSISEMAAELLYELGGKDSIKPDEATALLAGIIAATDHFSNNSTTADAMQIGADLIKSGANRELISENIGLDSQNMFFRTNENKADNESSTILDIDHDDDETTTDTKQEIVADLENGPSDTSTEKDALPDLKAVVDDLAKAEAIAKPHLEPTQPMEPANTAIEPTSQPTTPAEDQSILVMPTMTSPSAPTNSTTDTIEDTTKSETVVAPSEDFVVEPDDVSSDKYGRMLEDALAETGETSAMPPTYSEPSDQDGQTPTELDATDNNLTRQASVAPDATNQSATVSPVEQVDMAAQTTTVSPVEQVDITTQTTVVDPAEQAAPLDQTIQTNPTIPLDQTNPAYSASPTVPTKPDINGVPIINYAAVPNDNILPPPPAPPIDLNSPLPTMPPSYNP